MAQSIFSFSTPLSTFLVLIVLIFSIANYYNLIYKFRELDKKLVAHRGNEPTEPILELRKSALLAAASVRAQVLRNAIGEQNGQFYGKLRAEAYCHEKWRIGEKGDGGKVVCRPKAVRPDCTLMSLGLNNQVEYDTKIWKATGEKCLILGADKDAQNMNTIRAYSNINGRLFTGKIPDELTIPEILEKSNRRQIEILKIDIEGGEHTGLEPLLKQFYVCQILIEVHGWPAEHLKMLQTIARYGFRIFNIEPNNLCSRCCVSIDLEHVELKLMRQKALSQAPRVREHILELSRRNETHLFYEALRVEAFCPLKMRVGGEGDSGKVTCDPRRAKDQCTMMSLGLNDQIQFDEQIQSITANRCNIIGADMTKQNATTREKYSRMRGQLFVGRIPDTLKLFRMMIDSGSKEVEILKIDIESGEHDALEPFLQNYFVCQILVEIHGYPAKQLEMLRKISNMGFRLFNFEPNPSCRICCEYSFINEMCMSRFRVTPLASIIPG